MSRDFEVIPMGHRCWITSSLRDNDLRFEALPFDYIISSFNGVIDCLNDNFESFLPEDQIERDQTEHEGKVYKMFRVGDRFFVNHFDLDNPKILKKFKVKIERFNQKLKGTKNIVFLRSIMDKCEIPIKLADRFVEAVKKIINPDIKFKLIYVVCNSRYPENIYQIDDQVYIARCKNPKFTFLVDFLKNSDPFNHIMEKIYIDQSFNRICYGGWGFCFNKSGIDSSVINKLE